MYKSKTVSEVKRSGLWLLFQERFAIVLRFDVEVFNKILVKVSDWSCPVEIPQLWSVAKKYWYSFKFPSTEGSVSINDVDGKNTLSTNSKFVDEDDFL